MSTAATNTKKSNLPRAAMKCAIATGFTGTNYGEVDGILTYSTMPKPTLDPKKSQMLVRVMACSISAGDTNVMTGNMRMIKPQLPFVPGMDICGEVVDITAKVKSFKVGDVIVADNGMMPVGGMAEYMVVNPANAAIKPKSIDYLQAAACSSAVTSLHSVDFCKKGDRVLILGGSGGVGSSAIAISKIAGASFVATTSTQKQMCLDLGADEVINYKETNWWEVDDFKREKFDVIIDAVGGGNFYGRATEVLKLGKKGGKFIAVTGDNPHPNLSSWFKVLKYILKLPGRPLYTSVRSRKYPKFILLLPHDTQSGMARVLKLMDEGKLNVILDPASPHDFSEEGVKAAFKVQGGGHAHGKVVVKMEG